jgi:subtilase family serine protease
MLRLAISLKSPHPQEEEDLVRQLHDPESSQFHQYLSAEQWNARFAPSVEDEQAVIDWAHSQGLTVTNRFPNRLLVDVEAPVSAIERAFDVSINSYQKDGKPYFSIDRDPSIPSSLSNTVLFVFGLNNFDAMHHMSPTKGRLPENTFPIYSAGPAFAISGNLQRDGDPAKAAKLNSKVKKYDQYNPYGPPDLYTSYAYNYSPLQSLGHCCNPLNHPGSSPPEASIAVAIWGDYADADIQLWVNQFGLALNATRVLVDGAHQCSADNCDFEATADLEYSTAMANSFGSAGTTAAVYVYEGPNGNAMEDVLNRIMNDGHVRVVNMSWGGAERYFLDGEIDSCFAPWSNRVLRRSRRPVMEAPRLIARPRPCRTRPAIPM